MDAKQFQTVPPEYVAEKVGKLKTVFYDTPDMFFESLAEILNSLELSTYKFNTMMNKAIFTVRKTKITVADIIDNNDDLWMEKFG